MATERQRTRGAEQTAAALLQGYGRVAVAFPSPRSGMLIERDQLDEATLDRIDMNFRAEFDVDPLPVIAVVRVLGGRLQLDVGATIDLSGPGDLLISPSERPYTSQTDTFSGEFTNLFPALLNEVAWTRHDPDTEPVRLSGTRPISPVAAMQFNRARAFALQTRRSLADEPGTGAGRLLRASLDRLLAAAVLGAFPNTAVTAPTYLDRHDAHPDTLRRAVAFIEANPDLNLSVADVARAAYVTPRAIQLAFRRHLDTTPMAYLRRVRLDRAHADLLAATPDDGSTVTEISARWGWGRPSRFAAEYRAAYGRHPSDDLDA